MLLVLGLLFFFANGDNYAAAALIGDIAHDLGLNVSTAALSVTAYMLSYGFFTILFGPLADRFGKVNVINTAALGTAIFSILGAMAFNLESLVFFRAVNGMFGAGIFPVAIALIGESFDDANRHKALGKAMGLGFLGAATATAIGGMIAHYGSWRYVYLTYGVAELILGLMMLKMLQRDQPSTDTFKLFSSYGAAFSNIRFMSLVSVLFMLGFTVLGSFTYSGLHLQNFTGFSTLLVGVMLSAFGIGTVAGGRLAPTLRKKLKSAFLLFAGLLGAISLYVIASIDILALKVISFTGLGMAFISLQTTIISMAQERLPHMKGTAMALAAFNMFLGAGAGTTINGRIVESSGTSQVFINASVLILIVGVVSAVLVNKLNAEKKLVLKANPA